MLKINDEEFMIQLNKAIFNDLGTLITNHILEVCTDKYNESSIHLDLTDAQDVSQVCMRLEYLTTESCKEHIIQLYLECPYFSANVVGTFFDRIARNIIHDLDIAFFACDIVEKYVNDRIKNGPNKKLLCCCCSELCTGRQWHNRDYGFGICENCVEWQKKSETPEEMLSFYGHEGIHYNLNKGGNKDVN